MLLQDKVAVIYGAGAAIGGAVARAFAGEGAELFSPGTCGHRSKRLPRTSLPPAEPPRRHRSTPSTSRLRDEHLQSVTDTAGRVDISFNAAGIPNPKIPGVPLARLDAGQFNLTQALHALLTRRGLS